MRHEALPSFICAYDSTFFFLPRLFLASRQLQSTGLWYFYLRFLTSLPFIRFLLALRHILMTLAEPSTLLGPTEVSIHVFACLRLNRPIPYFFFFLASSYLVVSFPFCSLSLGNTAYAFFPLTVFAFILFFSVALRVGPFSTFVPCPLFSPARFLP